MKLKRSHDVPRGTFDLQELGTVLMQRRQELDLRTVQLAANSNVSLPFIANVENGAIDSVQFGKLKALCSGLGYELRFVLTERKAV